MIEYERAKNQDVVKKAKKQKATPRTKRERGNSYHQTPKKEDQKKEDHHEFKARSVMHSNKDPVVFQVES